ncbi:FCD domain-containing protein [Paracoccus sp. Z330]|uniref:FCD domain-containing protein n=1 Tax=Paracoccus onchidii TaxID=3017813 RepID=A0ABT4ZKA8_9RHOB|nr:FCD domain-containing protein [Paracoccus onchidii]MDB6179644.1 FCD domain-containing protein [Paracoccus onchidii]
MTPGNATQPTEQPISLQDGETHAESAYRRLRTDIISGEREPGERLRVERLSKLYGIGTTPLREAMQRLCSDRLATAHGNRGFTVAPLEADEFEDLNIARTAIEVQAVTLSIQHGDEAWESTIVATSYRLQKQDRFLAKNPGTALDAWEAANAAFHDATVAACGSVWLLRVRKLLMDQVERYRRASVCLHSSERDLASEHSAIMDAVLERDAARAREVITAHFDITARILLGDIAQDEAAGLD